MGATLPRPPHGFARAWRAAGDSVRTEALRSSLAAHIAVNVERADAIASTRPTCRSAKRPARRAAPERSAPNHELAPRHELRHVEVLRRTGAATHARLPVGGDP